MDKSSDALDAATYFAALHKRINGGRMPNSLVGSLLGQNITASQANQLGLANANAAAGQQLIGNGAQQASWNAAQGMHTGAQMPLYPKARDVRNERLEMHVKITQAENGFIVNVCNAYGDILQPHIAATMEDVTTIVTSQLASRMLDRTER